MAESGELNGDERFEVESSSETCDVGFAASTGFSSGQLPETTFAPAFGLGISNCTTSDSLQLTTTKSELGINIGTVTTSASFGFPLGVTTTATTAAIPATTIGKASYRVSSTSIPLSIFPSTNVPKKSKTSYFGIIPQSSTTGFHYGSQCASNISSLPSTSFPSLSKPPATSKTLPVSAASGFNISTSYPPSSNVGFAASTGFSSGQLPETTFAPAFGLGISNCTTSDSLQLTTTKSELGINIGTVTTSASFGFPLGVTTTATTAAIPATTIGKASYRVSSTSIPLSIFPSTNVPKKSKTSYFGIIPQSSTTGFHYGSQCASNISSLPSTSFPSLSKPPATSKTLPVSAASGFNISTSYPPSSNVGFAASTGFSSGQLPETTFAPAFGLGISNCTTSDSLQLTTTKSELGINIGTVTTSASFGFPLGVTTTATTAAIPATTIGKASYRVSSTSIPLSIFPSTNVPKKSKTSYFGIIPQSSTTGFHYGSQCASNISSLPSTSFPSLSKPPATSKTLPVSAASGFNISTSYPPSSNKDGNNKRKRISETETDDFSVENSSSSLQNEAIEGGDNKKNKEEDDSYDEVLFVIDTNQFLHKLPLIRKLFEIHEIKAFTFGNSPVISSYVPLPHTSTNPDGSKKLKFGPPNARDKPIRSNSAGFIKKKIGIAMGVRLELDKKKQDKRLATIARRSTNLLDTYARSKDVVTQSFQEFEDFKQGNDSMDLSILKFCMNLAETRSSSKVVLVSDDKNFHGIAAASFIAVLNSYDLKRIIDPLVADDQNVKFVKELREFESLKNIFRAMSEEDKNKILQFPRVFLKTVMDH